MQSSPPGSSLAGNAGGDLLLIIRAKLEAVESGLTTLENEFLANILLPDGGTVGEWLAPQIDEAYGTGRMPAMLELGTLHK